MRLGADTVKKCFLELGGKSANIVLDDADFADRDRHSAFMVVAHGGQGCSTLTRLLLPRVALRGGRRDGGADHGLVPYGDPPIPRTSWAR